MPTSWRSFFYVESQLGYLVYLHQRWLDKNGLEMYVLLGFTQFLRIPEVQKFT